MSVLLESSNFLGLTRRKMRCGELSREPLTLLRFEWKGEAVECDWLIRPNDSWDRYLPWELARENQSLQALRDALDLRESIFRCFPGVENACLRMFRVDALRRLELVMTGSVSRTNEVLHRVASVAMRAKLCGFTFTLAEGDLQSMAQMPLEGC
jgi:hypothetical protein